MNISFFRHIYHFNYARFLRDTARSGIVSVSILANLGLSRFILELGGTELFGENSLLVGLLPSLLPRGFCFNDSDDYGWSQDGYSYRINDEYFPCQYAKCWNRCFATGFSSALMGAFFCREVRLRGTALKAGAIAGLTAAIMLVGIGLASGSGAFASINQAGVSILVGLFTGALVLEAMLIENGFKVATDATLFELTDFNHPLLRQNASGGPRFLPSQLDGGKSCRKCCYSRGGESDFMQGSIPVS